MANSHWIRTKIEKFVCVWHLANKLINCLLVILQTKQYVVMYVYEIGVTVDPAVGRIARKLLFRLF